jgi:MYXO-CTERM domain-containing protein
VWKNVGTATKATLDALPLVDGRRYDVAVRALTGEGERSPDRLSNGVRVHFTAGAGGAGGAAGAGGATGKGGGGVAGGHPGAGGAPATMPSSDQPTVTGDGCGCAVPSRSGSIPATAAAIALAAALVARRRRAPRSR